MNTKGEGEKSSEDFWVKAERLYYSALIGYIWYEATEEEKNFITLLDLINASEARENDETYQSPVDLLFSQLEEREPDHFAVKQYRKFKMAAGETSKYFIICVSAIVSIILNAYAGASQVDQTLVGAARMLGAKPTQIFLYITLPASVPQIFAGLQVGLSSSWMAVIAAEMIRANEGAGWIITTGMESGNTVQILAGMISIGLVGLLLASLLRLIERGLCSWNIQGR